MNQLGDEWLETLVDAYPNARVTANTLKILQNHVTVEAAKQGYDLEVIMAAVNAHISSSRFFPTVADLMDLLRSESTRLTANKISTGEKGGMVYPQHWEVCKECKMPSPSANTPQCYFCLGIEEARAESEPFMTPAWQASERVLDGGRLTLANGNAHIQRAQSRYPDDEHLPMLLTAIKLMTDGYDLNELVTR